MTIFGMKVKVDQALPPGVIEFRDPQTGKLLGRIITKEG